MDQFCYLKLDSLLPVAMDGKELDAFIENYEKPAKVTKNGHA